MTSPPAGAPDAPAVPSRFRAVAFSGSVRAGSSNTGLVRLAQRVAPPELTVTLFDDAPALPWYDADLERDLPDVVVRWRAAVAEADALIVGLPEYNFGPSGLAKNTIDWLTRPPAQRALQGKVIAFITSGGKGGGSQVQGPLGTILGLLGNTVVAEPPVQIPMGAERIAADGTTDDAEIVRLVTEKMANVVAFLAEREA